MTLGRRERPAIRLLLALLARAARRTIDRRDWKAACLLLRLARFLRPHPQLLALLGRVALRTENYPLALDSLCDAVRLCGVKPSYHVTLAQVYSALEYPHSAQTSLDTALSLDPSHAPAHIQVARLAWIRAEHNSAVQILTEAIALAKSSVTRANALLVLGGVHKDRADRQGTIDCALRVIAADPYRGSAYGSLAETRFYDRLDHPHIAQMEHLLRDRTLSPEVAGTLHFALGRVYDQHGRWEDAFSHFRRGNESRRRLLRHVIDYRARWAVEKASQRINVFTHDRVARLSRYGLDTDAIIFVVGMPRSGTTLVEQILDSHPHISGLGERPDVLTAMSRLRNLLSWSRYNYPRCCAYLNEDLVRQISEEIMAELSKLAPDARRIVLKRPDDAFELGLIHILFPRSRIIHCTRDPKDTCLSCYMQDFSEIPYASRLDHLATYYEQYLRIMAHWKSIIPAETMIDLRYEEIVTRTHDQINNLLKFCNVTFSQVCESFFSNDRQIETASAWQVREPVYDRSVGRWRHYERFLGPLRRLGAAEEAVQDSSVTSPNGRALGDTRVRC